MLHIDQRLAQVGVLVGKQRRLQAQDLLRDAQNLAGAVDFALGTPKGADL